MTLSSQWNVEINGQWIQKGHFISIGDVRTISVLWKLFLYLAEAKLMRWIKSWRTFYFYFVIFFLYVTIFNCFSFIVSMFWVIDSLVTEIFFSFLNVQCIIFIKRNILFNKKNMLSQTKEHFVEFIIKTFHTFYIDTNL